MLVACVAATTELLLLAGLPEHARLVALPAAPLVLLATTLYVAGATFVASHASRHRAIPGWMVNGIVVGDVAYVFALTIAASSPAYYGRVLILAFFALHLTTFYFGRGRGVVVLALTTAGYVSLASFAILQGAPLRWEEELWSVGAFLLAGTVVLVEHGSLRTRLTNMLLTDPLTGCVNRRGFDQALAREMSRATRSGTDLALLAVDVDHFKIVNDTFGHLVGDDVLRDVGAIMMRAARAGDVVARTGGEEFALILPDTSSAGAYHVATRLCAALHGHPFGAQGRPITLTVSIGVGAADSALRVLASDSIEILKSRADEALYEAKRGGRDRVRVWSQRAEQVELPMFI